MMQVTSTTNLAKLGRCLKISYVKSYKSKIKDEQKRVPERVQNILENYIINNGSYTYETRYLRMV
jgi:hypothetical protein